LVERADIDTEQPTEQLEDAPEEANP